MYAIMRNQKSIVVQRELSFGFHRQWASRDRHCNLQQLSRVAAHLSPILIIGHIYVANSI